MPSKLLITASLPEPGCHGSAFIIHDQYTIRIMGSSALNDLINGLKEAQEYLDRDNSFQREVDLRP